MKKAVFLTFFLALLLRFYYLVYPLGRVEMVTVDEAVYGVQSLQILRGLKPVFYPAQAYTGSPSAYLSAFLFFLFGFYPILLKVVPFIFSISSVALNYKLAKMVFGKGSFSFFVLLINALATPFWNNWSSRAGTGYVEASALGSALLILTLKMVGEISTRPQTFLFWGFLGGLGFWVQPTIVYNLLPSLIFLVVNKKRLLFERKSYLSILGFFSGSLPVVLFNIQNHSATVSSLFRKPWGVRVAFIKLATEGFPVLLGVRAPNTTEDFFRPLAFCLEAVFLVALAYILRDRWREKRLLLEPIDLVLLTFFTTVSVFLLSTPFNQFSIEPRYVFSLYITMPMILAFFLTRLRQRQPFIFSFLALALLLNWVLGITRAGPEAFYDRYQVRHLEEFLERRGVSYVIADPALGHRLMFYSQLKILASVRGGGITEWRFPEINREVVRARDENIKTINYVALKGTPFEADFKREISGFGSGKVGGVSVGSHFVVIDSP